MTKIKEAYYKAIKLGLLEDMVKNPTLVFEQDKDEFKRSWIQMKKDNPDFRLL